MNMSLYGHDGQWLMVDCGVTFNEPLTPQSKRTFNMLAADPTFISQRHEQLVGLVITHAHEDHIGAVAELWPRLRCPIYATRFSAECLQRKLAEKGLLGKVRVQVMASQATAQIGRFAVQWLAQTHSIPEAHALLIRTAAGKVLHTGDWKIDPRPVVGSPFDPLPLQALAAENIDAVICDSTNAPQPGRSLAESDCYPGLLKTIGEAEGRVVVACFGSNIARLITVCSIAKETGRFVGLLGRSLLNMVSIAKNTGYWPESLELSEPHQLGYLPAREVLLIATGSQGEPRTALNRLAAGEQRDIELEPGDTVIFSAMLIPGNEKPVARLIEKLDADGINVIQSASSDIPIHTSGHPCAEELADLYGWVKPRLAIPVHGEPEHLLANATIAQQSGVSGCLTGANGDLFVINGVGSVRKGAVASGRIILRH